jgi:hypothetical protein
LLTLVLQQLLLLLLYLGFKLLLERLLLLQRANDVIRRCLSGHKE